MGKYFARDPADGKYHDITHTHHPAAHIHDTYKSWYLTNVGTTRIGYVIHNHIGYWTAISTADNPLGLRKVDGFATRWTATEYLLRAHGIWKED